MFYSAVLFFLTHFGGLEAPETFPVSLECTNYRERDWAAAGGGSRGRFYIF